MACLGLEWTPSALCLQVNIEAKRSLLVKQEHSHVEWFEHRRNPGVSILEASKKIDEMWVSQRSTMDPLRSPYKGPLVVGVMGLRGQAS